MVERIFWKNLVDLRILTSNDYKVSKRVPKNLKFRSLLLPRFEVQNFLDIINSYGLNTFEASFYSGFI